MFISLEGIDGCGKTTQAELLARKLLETGRSVLWTKEPGGWEGGASIRELLLAENFAHPLSELFLFLFDRCEHVRRVISPVLAEGGIVVCERYTDSTLAYQAWGRGFPTARIESLFEWCDFPTPDCTFWLDIPVNTALERMSRRGSHDRFEAEGSAFLERVRVGFASLAAMNSHRIFRIDALDEPRSVCERIFSLLEVSNSL